MKLNLMTRTIYIFAFFFINFAWASPNLHSESFNRQIHNGRDVITDSGTIYYPPFFSRRDYQELKRKIGYIYPPFSTIEHKKYVNNLPAYTANYQISSFGLRATSKNKSASQHFIIAGDSNVFSEGCNNDQTLDFYLAQKFKRHQFYNFGHRGGGPHSTLALWEHYPVYQLISEKEGIFLYNLFPSYMLERVIGSKNYVAWDRGLSPWYALNDKDEAEYKGQFKDRWLTSVFSLIARIDWLNQLLPTLPQINNRHIHLIGKIFFRMKGLYQKSYPKGRFIVLLNSSIAEDPNTEKLKLELKRLGIETLEIAYPKKDIRSLTHVDGHFNPEGQKWQADLIYNSLKNLFSSSSDQQHKSLLQK